MRFSNFEPARETCNSWNLGMQRVNDGRSGAKNTLRAPRFEQRAQPAALGNRVIVRCERRMEEATP